MKRVIWCIVGGDGRRGTGEGGQLTVNGVSCRGSRKSRHLNKTASGKIPLKPSEACFPAVEQVGVVHCVAALSALWEPSSKKKIKKKKLSAFFFFFFPLLSSPPAPI